MKILKCEGTSSNANGKEQKNYLKNVLFFAISIILVVSFGFHIRNAFRYTSLKPSHENAMALENGVVYTQEIRDIDNPIVGFSLLFGTYARTNSGTLSIAVRENDEIIKSWEISVSDLADKAWVDFSLDSEIGVGDNKTSKYYLDISESYEGDNAIAVYYSNYQIGSSEVDFCIKWTLVNTVQRNRYMPLYIIIMCILVLFTFVIVDFNKVKIPRMIVTGLILLIVIRMFDYDLFQSLDTRTTVLTYRQNDNIETVLPGSEKSFELDEIHVSFSSIAIFPEDDNRNNIHLELENVETGEIVYSNDMATEELYEDENTGKTSIVINRQSDFPKGKYRLNIYNDGEEEFAINSSGNGKLNVVVYKDTFLTQKMAVLIMFLLAVMFIFAVNYAIDKFSIEKVYLVVIIPLAISYMILFVPWSQPDTHSHFLATYRWSNIILGYDGEQEWYGRTEDVEFYNTAWAKDNNPSLKSYYGVWGNLHIKCEKSDMQPMSYQPDKMKFYSIVNYLPEVLGLTLGRLLKLSAVLCIYMGKLFVLLLYIWATYRAIKRTPVGKGVFFVTATLPMSLMMSGAISYDPMVILSTISLISCIFELCEKKNSKTVFIETLIWVFVVGAVKGGGFLILLPLAFMLIDKKNLKKSIITVACIIGIGIFSVVLFNKIIPAGMEFFQLGTDGNGKLTAAYALQHPLNFLDMSIKAYLGDFDLLTLNQGGYALAWLEGTLPLTLVAIMMVLGGVYSIFEKDEMKFRQRDKYVFIAVILVSVISTPAMLLSWTNVVSRAILGLQGRYYLPLLPLALFLMTKFSLHHPLEDGIAEETSDGAAVRKRILIMYMIVSCVAVYYMMRLYLTRG